MSLCGRSVLGTALRSRLPPQQLTAFSAFLMLLSFFIMDNVTRSCDTPPSLPTVAGSGTPTLTLSLKGHFSKMR